MNKPRKIEHFQGKPKNLYKAASRQELEKAAEKASYSPSDYHCPDENGRIRKRTKPNSRCPHVWTVRDGTIAVRNAIRAGRVSRQWTRDGYPRHIWHEAGGVWYEACTSDNQDGAYHGYPVEVQFLPVGLSR